MKKRLLAFALASTMLFTSFNVAYAEDTAVADDIVIAEEAAVDDAVESDAAVEDEASSSGGGGSAVIADAAEEDADDLADDGIMALADAPGIDYVHEAVDPWKATAFGDIANQEKLGPSYKFDPGTGIISVGNKVQIDGDNGGMVDAFEIRGTENEVHMRAGSNATPTGKVSGSSTGGAYYYRQIDKDEDFTISAKGHINSIYDASKDNGQIAFGIMFRDELHPDCSYPQGDYNVPPTVTYNADAETYVAKYNLYPYGDELGVGHLDIRSGSLQNAWAREDGTLNKKIMAYDGATPLAGTEFTVTMKKSGSVFTLYYNDERVTYDGSVLNYNGDKALDKDYNYVGLFATRAIDITWTDISYVPDIPASSIEIVKGPDKTVYNVNEKFDPKGMEINATYMIDGAPVVQPVDMTDDTAYTILGFDDQSNMSFESVGTKTLTVHVGNGSATFQITVQSLEVTGLELYTAPSKLKYSAESYFNPFGVSATATLNDGSTKELNKIKEGQSAYANYKFVMDGKEIDGSTKFTAADAGTKTVRLYYTDKDENIKNGDIYVEFQIVIDAAAPISISVDVKPTITLYYIGQEFNPGGIVVKAIYNEYENGILTPDEYEITGFRSDVENDNLLLTVTYKANPSLTATFPVKILKAFPTMTVVDTYPRTTYSVGESFSVRNFAMSVMYSDGSIKDITKYANAGEAYYYKDEDGFYTQVGDDAATKTPVEENVALSQDFYFDLTDFDSSTSTEDNPKKVIAVINQGLYPDCLSPEFDITIVDENKYVWNAMVMGQIDQGGDNDASITVTKTDGTKQSAYKKALNVDPQVMVNGVLPDVQSVNLHNINKAGKIATDHDGITYYYTKVDADKNFELSADVSVNKYLASYAEMDDTQKGKYDKAIADGASPELAIDMARDGQEGFGIMAKDTIQLAGGVDGDKYLGRTAKDAVVPANAAKVYYVFDGNNNFVTYAYDKDSANVAASGAGAGAWVYEGAASLYEAFCIGLPIRTTSGGDYDITSADLNKAFSTNMVIAGGVTDGTWPTNPDSSTYNQKINMDRINIMIRNGVTATDGSGSGGKEWVASTTTHLPKTGDKYNITLKKFNTGFQITTVEYIFDEDGNIKGQKDPVTQYAYDNILQSAGLLNTIDHDNYYIGFFGSRRADIDVTNIKLSESNPATDPSLSGTEVKSNNPRITVSSSTSTDTTAYTLRFKSNAQKNYYGIGTVTLNGQQIWEGSIGNSSISVDSTLKENDLNTFVITYYPNTADTTLVNYDTVVKKFYVTHNSFLDSQGTIYIAPNGKATAKGTKNDPVDIETGIQFLSAGATGIMADGTYNLKNDDIAKIEIDENHRGYVNMPITLKAEEGAHPVIDLQKKFEGFSIDGDYWVISGLEVCNSKDNGKAFALGGNHCVIEYCTFHSNGDTGFQISRINGDDDDITKWPSYNVVRSCEAYDNYDPSQNNADGFAAKLTVGYGNVFEDCVSHHNADDGWDCYTKLGTGAIGASVLENCISYRQKRKLDFSKIGDDGVVSDNLTNGSGGNGFKLGGEDIFVKHYLKDCISWENTDGNGVDTNNNPAIKVRNVVAYGNNRNFGLYGNPTESLVVNGSTTSPDGKMYKYDYDLEGAVSINGINPERINGWNVAGTENYANIRETEKPSNYLWKDKDSKVVNSEGKELVPLDMVKSLDKYSVIDVNQRYSRNSDGSFNHGDFLALKTPYKHNPEDLVVLPGLDGSTGNVGPATEATEATTVSPGTNTGSNNHGGGGGGGGGGGKPTVKETTTQATTTAAASENNEQGKPSVITKDVKVTIGASEIVVGDQTIPVDASAYIQKDSSSTLVPLRVVAIAILGGDVANADTSDIIAWDAQAKAATITAGDDTIVFTAGSPDMVINGESKTMANGVKAEITDGRMYVPFRALGEALGVEVAWDAETKTASFIAPVAEEPEYTVTQELLAAAAEALDQILAVSVDKVEALSEEDKAVYAENCDKLATIQQDVASEMTDENVQADYAVLAELVEYFRVELPEKVGTADEVEKLVEELVASYDTEAETAEATTVAE